MAVSSYVRKRVNGSSRAFDTIGSTAPALPFMEMTWWLQINPSTRDSLVFAHFRRVSPVLIGVD
jgi:hypothetical protein